MKTTPVSAAIALSLFLISGISARAAEPKVEETDIGRTGAGGLYVISQNDARIAYVGAKGTKTVVSVDGVEGPVLDEIFNGSAASIPGGGQILVHNANPGGKFNGTPSAVLFSEQGSHYAYIGRQGNDYVVIHDGKEVGRGPRNSLSLQHSPLGLSPKGTHAFWGEMKTEGGRGQYRLIMDGKPEPWAGHQELKPVFSPDDKRYAYNAGTVENYQKQVLIIDGKVASYVGHSAQWTGDSKTLLSIAPGNVVLVDGKPGPYTGIQIDKIIPAPVGSRFAVIMRKKLVNNQGVGTLYLDGKEVPGTEGAMDITFSPDGKRWALRCQNAEARSFFMVIDGKKGNEYQAVSEKAWWTPDSSTVLYQISSSGRQFVVINHEEIAVANVSSLARGPFVFSDKGTRHAFSSVDGANRNFLTVVDGKNVLPAGHFPDGDSLEFSENGERYVMAVGKAGQQGGGVTMLLDNGKLDEALAVESFVMPPRASRSSGYFRLSPDGKYIARMARTAQNTNRGLHINNKLVYPAQQSIAFPTFTPDSKHLFWLAMEKVPNSTQLQQVLYVDGTPVKNISREGNLGSINGTVAMDAKGVFTMVALVGDTVKRLRVTPAADMDIDKMIVQAEEAQAKAIADAATARKKAEDDAQAAAAKKKADADALAAKKKADYDAAVAKKKADAKARADAAAAKKKQ